MHHKLWYLLLTTLDTDVQAPQRERVSLVVRGSVLLQSTGDALKTDSSWKRKIKGNNLESIPRLLWLLEPKIVFAHAKVRLGQGMSMHAISRVLTHGLWSAGKLQGAVCRVAVLSGHVF